MPQLSELVKAAGDIMPTGRVSFCPPARWVFQPASCDLLVQIEPGVSDGLLILNTTLARDGSGPILASFMSTLFIEESHATSPSGLGVCSGSVSVTFFICRSTAGLRTAGFVQLVSWTADSLVPPAAPVPASEEQVSLLAPHRPQRRWVSTARPSWAICVPPTMGCRQRTD